MARKLIDLEEAAKMLGVTPDALNDMRSRHEVSAYRDGTTWKFKAEDIEKLIAERQGGLETEEQSEFAELDDNLDSILLGDVDQQADSGTSSTVIGKTPESNPSESDIRIAESRNDESSLGLGSSLGSDVRLASGSNILQPGSGISARFDDLDALDLDLPSPADSGVSIGSSGLNFTSGSGLSLDDNDLSLGEEPVTAKPPSSKKGGSALQLDSDDDLVLGGSGTGSDITHSAGDSGISLVDPADSGLSLEQAPLDLGGSGAESLELGEDDMVLMEDPDSTEAATQLKSDDDFLLTPLEEAGGEESDSGSQVIALDSEVEFDDAASTMLSDSSIGGAPMLEEDLGGDLGAPAGAGLGFSPAGGATLMSSAHAAESPYSGANIALLTLCVLMLMIIGMMTYDLLRNMWSWDSAYSVNSSIMDMILGWFE